MSDLPAFIGKTRAITRTVEEPFLSHDSEALQELEMHNETSLRAGNYVNSALAVMQHVAGDFDISRRNAQRLNLILRQQTLIHEESLANIRALQETLEREMVRRASEEKFVGQSDRSESPFSIRWNIGVAATRNEVAPSADERALLYWRQVRNDLAAWFALSLEDLSVILGVSYATFANLGKHRPQGRTIRPILRLHGLARAYLNAMGESGQAWLASEGCAILREDGIEKFDEIVSTELFKNVRVERNAIRLEDEPEVTWLPMPSAPSSTENF